MTGKIISILILVFLIVSCRDDTYKEKLDQYEKEIIELKNQYNLPSVSIAIVSNQEIIYSNGFGYADIENEVTATDSTPYRIASVTKPIASTLILKLIESNSFELHSKIKDYWSGYYEYFSNLEKMINEKAPEYNYLIDNYNFENFDITLFHHLTHTSEGIPGEKFKYNGFLFSELSTIIDNINEKDFYSLVKEDIILSLGMKNSLPQQSDQWRPKVLKELAKPYKLNDKNKMVLSAYPKPNLGAGAGIISTVTDLAKFDIALDKGELISNESKKIAFTPTKLNNKKSSPYGLGWFIGTYKNNKIVFHTGWQPGSFSELYIKVLDRNLSLILLANSEDLIAPVMKDLEKGKIDSSPFAKNFLDLFL